MSTPFHVVVWLVALQFALYATGWALCSALSRQHRAAALHWAAFMLATGCGFLLTGLRGEPRTWWAFTGSGVAFLTGYVVLHRGLEHFLGRPPRDVEHAACLGVAVALLVAVGPSADHAPLRVVLTYGVGALLVARLLLRVHGPLADEYGASLSHLLALPAYLLVAGLGSRAFTQLTDWNGPHELHRLDATNTDLMFGYLIGAALFNFSFIALVTLRAVRHLSELSRRDALTGLLNRRAIDETIDREWQRFHRRGAPFAVVAIDLDHFKRINDQHGHQTGDEVLVQAAQHIRQAARGTDAVARHGGEEFLVLMPDADLPSAAAAAERLLERLRGCACDVGGRALRITASAGVAQVSAADGDPRAVLQRADAALYRAKSAGRDRVATDGEAVSAA